MDTACHKGQGGKEGGLGFLLINKIYVLVQIPEAMARTASNPSPFPSAFYLSKKSIQKERKKKKKNPFSLQLQRPLEQNLPNILPDLDPMWSFRQDPLLLRDVPDAEIFPAEGEREGPRFTRGKAFLFETA